MKRYFIIITLFFIAFSFGVVVGKYQIFPYEQTRFMYSKLRSIFNKKEDLRSGRWYEKRRRQELSKTQQDDLSKIATLPYLKGYNPPSKKSGIAVYNRKHAYSGYNLFCSGHAPKVFLMSMEGTILHEWEIPFDKVWPNSLPFYTKNEHKEFIRRAHLFPNGDLLAIFEYIGLVKLDKQSNILWSHLGQNHHDLAIYENGDILTLGREILEVPEIRERYPNSSYRYPIQDDQIIILNSYGKEKRRISIIESFYKSNFASFLSYASKGGDIFHSNSIQIINKSITNQFSNFNTGDFLISLRNMNTIVIIDSVEGIVKWALSGMWCKQHKAIFLSNGNILLFDNLGGNVNSFFELNQSRVIEFKPHTQEIVWQYNGTINDPFFTHWLGYNQRLKNGNTLITESDQGRIFEVLPNNTIVWEYVNPYRTGKNNELIATIMSAVRVDPDHISF